MDEAQRFFRYLTPGLTVAILIVLYSFLSQHDWTVWVIKEIRSDGISASIGLLLTSGGIGFILSVFHHALFWSPIYRKYGGTLDHRQVLEHASTMGRLDLRLRNGCPKDRKLSHIGAWRVASSIWHERRESSLQIKAADQRTKSLSDIMHGAGTAFLGSVAALLMWGFLHLSHVSCRPSSSFWVIFIIATFIVVIHWWNFRQTVKLCQGVIGIVLSDELRLERILKKEPVVAIISEDDLE